MENREYRWIDKQTQDNYHMCLWLHPSRHNNSATKHDTNNLFFCYFAMYLNTNSLYWQNHHLELNRIVQMILLQHVCCRDINVYCSATEGYILCDSNVVRRKSINHQALQKRAFRVLSSTSTRCLTHPCYKHNSCQCRNVKSDLAFLTAKDNNQDM